MDALYDTECQPRACRDAACAQALRAVAVCGAWQITRCRRSPMARLVDANVETDRRWMPPQSADPGPHRTCRVPRRSAAHRLHERTEADDLHVRRECSADVMRECRLPQ